MININNLRQVTRFDNDVQSHILLNKEICKKCEQHFCVGSCPANCYSFSQEMNRLDVAYETCLECGTCMIVCDRKAVNWTYPRGGFGVHYRMT